MSASAAYTEYASDIRKILARREPSSVIAIDPTGKAVMGDYRRTHPDCEIRFITDVRELATLQPPMRYDFAYTANTLEHLEKSQAQSLIASLRDLHAREFWLVVPIGCRSKLHRSHWEAADFTALGLCLVARYENHISLYAFNIANYKQTPKWLNPDDWANQDRWNKGRW